MFRAIGLDLWNKKGFLTWSKIIFSNDPSYTEKSVILPQPAASEIQPNLILHLANLLTDWSKKI